METHRFLRLGLCLLLLSLQGITEVSGAIFTCSYNPSSTVTLGAANTSLTCNHAISPGTSERLLRTVWHVRKTPSSQFEEIFVGYFNPAEAVFSTTTVGQEYKNRATVATTDSSTVLTISEINCSDEVVFNVALEYRDTDQKTTATNISVLVQAPARSPQSFSMSPVGPVTENSVMTFTCAANLGTRLTGSIRWELYLKDSNTYEDVTSQANTSEVADTAAPCTKVVTSRLQLTIDRRHHQAVVRCQPLRTGQTNPAFNQTARLEVLYRVLDSNVVIGMNPLRNPYVVKDAVTLTCTAVSNPSPSFSWTKENSNWTQTGDTVTFPQLELEDAGRYLCLATNNVSGTLYNASSATNVNVVEEPPTTTPTTTTLGPDSSPGDGGATAPSNQPQPDNTGMIIGIVIGCVAFIAIVVIIIVCVVMKKRRNKEIEEPSEKPYNNHQNINTISSQPDLVNDDKKYNYYKDDLSPYIDPKPRSRRPVDLGSSSYDSTTYMPQV